MSAENQETKLSNDNSELQLEGEEPLLSGGENQAKQQGNEADLAVEGEDNDDYDGLSKREICMIEKSKGSEKFKQNDYFTASKHFTKALMAFKYATQEIAEEGEEELLKAVKEIQIPCHLNLALCFLKQDEYDMAKVHANHVLEIDPDNVKGLYRRALVHYHKGYLTDAKDDLKLAYELEPNNQEIVKLMHMVKDKKKAQNDKEKKMNQKIIGNLEFEEPPAIKSTAQIQPQKGEEEAPKEGKSLKSKKVDGKDDFPELNKIERKMTRTVFENLKYGLSLPVNWVKNKCCARRSATKEKKND